MSGVDGADWGRVASVITFHFKVPSQRAERILDAPKGKGAALVAPCPEALSTHPVR